MRLGPRESSTMERSSALHQIYRLKHLRPAHLRHVVWRGFGQMLLGLDPGLDDSGATRPGSCGGGGTAGSGNSTWTSCSKCPSVAKPGKPAVEATSTLVWISRWSVLGITIVLAFVPSVPLNNECAFKDPQTTSVSSLQPTSLRPSWRQAPQKALGFIPSRQARHSRPSSTKVHASSHLPLREPLPPSCPELLLLMPKWFDLSAPAAGKCE